ncbi:hypothetical protein PN836_006550 [Ningiella sp. W23]|uniref:hypothetical protein n=1 Tax=Ningiella sp. W23 TaxID=3023715 RepID=UPI00375813EB
MTRISTCFWTGLASKSVFTTIGLMLYAPFFSQAAAPVNYHEQNGLVVIEAEHFASQHVDEKRRWLVFSEDTPAHNYADSDLNHALGASGGQYIEILPDTRTNHFESLIRGENFSNIAGHMAILSYPVYFETTGTYYVWARAFSTGTEDNGVHIGLNGTWPQSAQRLQLCKGKHQWTWSSAQRLKDNHCGTPHTITLEIDQPGVHNIMLSMREDGFELDQLLLTTDKNYIPTGIHPHPTLATRPALLEKTMLHEIKQYTRIFFATTDFTILSDDDEASEAVPVYPLEQAKTLAIDASITKHQNQYAYSQVRLERRDAGMRSLTLVAVSSVNTTSDYKVLVNNEELGRFAVAASEEEPKEHYFFIDAIALTEGDVITVASKTVVDKSAHHLETNNDEANKRVYGAQWRALVLGSEQH